VLTSALSYGKRCGKMLDGIYLQSCERGGAVPLVGFKPTDCRGGVGWSATGSSESQAD